MQLSEFKREINKAELKLSELNVNYFYGDMRRTNGVCCVLYAAVGPRLKNEFVKLFKPLRASERGFWLGKINDDHNLNKRKVALRLFEQYCISEKLYKEY